ncbi:MAG: hypothetical protein GF408_07900 [Candidatus Omnitrophica bacterium]|nr:hypothetical protein [Candidatus Omnitrophota bacterium]
MRTRVPLYIFLALSLSFQAHIRNPWFPDLVLIAVVFAGIVGGKIEGMVTGLAAGLLRGCFSPETFYADLFIFPAVGFASSVLAGKLFRFNPLVQMLLTVLMLFIVVTVHTSYIHSASGEGAAIASVLGKSWRVVVATAFASPIVFGVLGVFCGDPG